MYAHYDIEKATQKYFVFFKYFFILKHVVALSTLAGPILCSVADTKTKKEKTKTRKNCSMDQIHLLKETATGLLKHTSRDFRR